MECERGGGKPKPPPDLTGREPIFAGLNQKPVNIETRLLRESAKGRKHFCLFHISTLVEGQSKFKPRAEDIWSERNGPMGIRAGKPPFRRGHRQRPGAYPNRRFHPTCPSAGVYRSVESFEDRSGLAHRHLFCGLCAGGAGAACTH